VFIRPGETKDVEFDAAGLKQAKRLDFLKIAGSKAKSDDDAGDAKSAADVLAMADGNFMAFKSAASKLLGDATPSKKDDIVAALEELATKPE
jgi:hypothetical protein